MYHFIVLETLWDVKKTCFSQHTNGTAGKSLMCLTANPDTPFWWKIVLKIVSTAILSPLLPQLEQLYVYCERVETQ